MTERTEYQQTQHPIHNQAIAPLIKASYTPQQLTNIQQFLEQHQILNFKTTKSGLFPAAATADAENTGYKYVWVRDNIYVAYAHYVMGKYEVAANTLTGLTAYFQKFAFRFTDIIENPQLKEQVMKRPHIRFNGETLAEVEEDWEHAQNDALGYFLWLYCKLANEQEQAPYQPSLQDEECAMLLRLMRYFEAIRYWEDADSGHWEEGRKVSASSIGPIVAGLKTLQTLMQSGQLSAQGANESDTIAVLSELIEKGEAALNKILPWECRTPENERRYDAALLYLIYPLNVVTKSQAEAILADIESALTDRYGIARYPYDSFWCRDFQDLDRSIQTAKYTGREAWLKEHGRSVKRGEEAQWCIFDPIISAIYGQWFQESKEQESQNPEYLEFQTWHLNRALGQITGEGHTVEASKNAQKGSHEPVNIPAYRCPELYYLQHDNYVPNVSTPLLWTQANLCIALKQMECSLL